MSIGVAGRHLARTATPARPVNDVLVGGRHLARTATPLGAWLALPPTPDSDQAVGRVVAVK